MKIVLSADEVKAIVLERLNVDFVTSFDEVVFDGYSQFTTATIQNAPPKRESTVATAIRIQALTEEL